MMLTFLSKNGHINSTGEFMTKKNQKDRGIFISFEGPEGCGKTTQIGRLATLLEEAGNKVFVTREPGGTEIGEEIRHLLMHSSANKNMVPETELLLFAASRAQLVREVIIPKIEGGFFVLCDRFLDSTTVYQGVARKLGSHDVSTINNFAVGNLMPDLTIILDIPVDIGLQRIKHRASGIPDRMEKETLEFYHAVREGYLLLAKSIPDRFLIIDGTQDIEKIEAKIWNELEKRFG